MARSKTKLVRMRHRRGLKAKRAKATRKAAARKAGAK
jgi:hypothetical protein